MGKRQVRIAQKDIAGQAPELIGQKAQIILENNRVITGRVQHVTADALTVRDARFNIHQLAANDVWEVVYDKETLY